MRRDLPNGGKKGLKASFNVESSSFSQPVENQDLGANPCSQTDFDQDGDVDASATWKLPVGLGTGVQRDSFNSGNFIGARTAFKAQSFDISTAQLRPLSQGSSRSLLPSGFSQMPFENQIRGLRWRGEGVCCFLLAGSGGIDACRASRVLPHLLHFSTLSSGHLGHADLSGFRACVLLTELQEGPCYTECAKDLLSACKELASNSSAAVVVAVFLSALPGGPDRDPQAMQALHRSVLAAGADSVLFSCPQSPVASRHLQGAVQGTEAWHERIAEAIESAQAKLARAQEQRWQRHYQIALRKIVWKAPQTVFPHIPQEDMALGEREDGVGDCDFLRVIGSGAFGSVHLARHPRLGDVAVKVIKKASIKNIFDLAKVERELSILMGVLDHPNVLEILSCLHGSNNIYIVMEFLGEYTLHTYLNLRQNGSARNVVMLPFTEVQSIYGDMLKAIAHCHAAHVCHRDIKFKNAMINADGRVTMVDFGLAVHVAPGQELHDSCGTVPFAATEVMTCSPSRGYDGTAADVWSLAVCIIELLCGLGTTEGIAGLTPDDVTNYEHIANQCLLLSTEYVHQLVLSYAGKDVQGVHRDNLMSVMRGAFRENAKTRMSVADIGALEAFSAKAGPLPKLAKRRDHDVSESAEDEELSQGRSHRSARSTQPSYGSGSTFCEADEPAEPLSTDWTTPLEAADTSMRPVLPLLERIGGSQTVVKVVSTVYDWLLPRPEFGRFFLQCPLKMGRIRAGISSFLIELLSNPQGCDMDMITNVHWNLNVSDMLFTDFADSLLEAFRTWGSRGDSTMPEVQKRLEMLRAPITAGHRARLAAAQTDRCPQEVLWLVSTLESTPEDFARALSDLLAQDARLEGRYTGELAYSKLETFARLVWQGSIDKALEAVLSGDQPLFRQDIGCAMLFSENARQVLCEMGMEEEDARDLQVLMEHAGEMAVNKARTSRPQQMPGMGQDATWFIKTLLDLCKADPFLQYFAEKSKMDKCCESIFGIVTGGDVGSEFTKILRSAHQNLYITDARYSAFIAHIDKVLRAIFPWPAHPAAVANGAIRSLEGLRTEVLCGSTLRSSRLAAVEGIINASLECNKHKVAKKSRHRRVMAAMQRCAGVLFDDAIAKDSRINMFFRNTDPETKDRKARYLGCALSGTPPPGSLSKKEDGYPMSSAASVSSHGSGVSVSLGSNLRQQHRLLRITNYHFDIFLEHLGQALEREDPEAADLAPAQLESLRQHIVLPARSSRCPMSGASSRSNKSCPFRRATLEPSSLLEQIGGKDGIEMMLTRMEREAASKTMLLPFLPEGVRLPCHDAILKHLVAAASAVGEDVSSKSELQAEELQQAHADLGLLPEHLDQWLACFKSSMVASILPPEIAEKLNTCFVALASSLLPDAHPSTLESEKDMEWGKLQGLMDELGGEDGLGRLIETWYGYISHEPSISVFFTGSRPKVMMFQTRFWSEVLRQGLAPDGRRQIQMIRIHQHLRINHLHFDAFVKCLVQACEELSLSKSSYHLMRAAVECFRQQIVTE